LWTICPGLVSYCDLSDVCLMISEDYRREPSAPGLILLLTSCTSLFLHLQNGLPINLYFIVEIKNGMQFSWGEHIYIYMARFKIYAISTLWWATLRMPGN
jgi:hypothetical protein